MEDELQRIISQTQSASRTGRPVQTQGTEPNPVIDALTQRLLQQGQGISSSATSNIQSEIQAAMAGVQQAGEATAQRIQSERQREVGFAQDRASARLTGAMEARSGFATQVAGFRELTDTTEKSVRDLDQRYQEAMLANDANTANQLSQLRMQKLEFLQEQEQNFFSNLMQTAALQEQQASRAQEMSMFERGLDHDQQMMRQQFGFDWAMFEKQERKEDRQMLISLAAEFGVPIAENETMESMIAKVAPYVSEERALNLERMRAQIAESRAQAARAMRAEPSEQPFDDMTADILARSYMSGETGFLAGLRTNEQYAAVSQKIQKKTEEERQALQELATEASTQQDYLQTIDRMTQGLTDPERSRVTNAAMNIAATHQFPGRERQTTTLPQILGGTAKTWSEGTQSFLGWLTGMGGGTRF